MKKWLLALGLGSILVLGACGGGGDDGGGESSDGGDSSVAAGEEAYQDSCASCHGGDLEGGAGPALDNVGADYSVEEIEDIIENGTGSMPAMKNISDEDRTAIAEWLTSN
ncbi:MAG TPA: cytochrome c [Bacillota bacterium]|nr:cytochrome c [Bacillota bacterium]